MKSGRGRVHEYESLVQVAGQDETGMWRHIEHLSLVCLVALEQVVYAKLVSARRCRRVDEQMLVGVDVEVNRCWLAWKRVENGKDAHLLAEIGTVESGDMTQRVHYHEELIGGAQVLDGSRPPARALGLDELLVVKRDDLLEVGGHVEGARVHRHTHGPVHVRDGGGDEADVCRHQRRLEELETRLALARHVHIDKNVRVVLTRQAVARRQHHVVVLRPDACADRLVVGHCQEKMLVLAIEGDGQSARQSHLRLHSQRLAANNAHERAFEVAEHAAQLELLHTSEVDLEERRSLALTGCSCFCDDGGGRF